MPRRSGSKAKNRAGSGGLWHDLRPWVLGSLGFFALLFFLDWIAPGTTKMLPLFFGIIYGAVLLFQILNELSKPKDKRNWSVLWLPYWW